MLKIVLVSNFLNEHMLPICNNFLKSEKVESFIFIALQQQSEERFDLGFTDINMQYDFVLCAYINKNSLQNAFDIVQNADIAIIADAPNSFIHIRMKHNKLTFVCSERFYKKGLWRKYNPKTYKEINDRLLQYKNKNLYFLTIGAYTPYDLNILGFPLEKCYQWAYYPSICEFENNIIKDNIKILWVGRMVHVKHPEIAIKVIKKLKRELTNFELTMIGNGAEYKKILRIVKKNKLEKYIKLKGVCPPKKVQEYMEKSDIFLFTSDYWEGWGAVLSEAMGHACIPIASIKAGASSILIEDKENGFTYCTTDQIVQRILKICHDKKLRLSMSQKAKDTILNKWSAKIAVGRFLNVAQTILEKEEVLSYNDGGPMASPKLRRAKNYFYTSW